MPGFTTHYILGMKAYNDMPQNNLNSSLQNTAGFTSLVFRDRICFFIICLFCATGITAT